MNSIVSFKDIDIARDGTLRCGVWRDGSQSDFYIRLPYSFEPETDLVVAAFVAIVGTAFEQIHIDLPIGREQKDSLEAWSRSQIVAHQGSDVRRRAGFRSALNFSGGFDSLAARVLEPHAELISLDFGGRFSRERKFFERFDPYVLETNLVDIGLNRYAWSFMGIGSLLMRDELQLGAYSFGSIMAGTARRLAEIPIDQRQSGLGPAEYFGMRVANPVAGLSEIASMKLVALTRPDLLGDILKSVALPQEEKYVRKFQMLSAVLHDLEISVDLSTALPKRPQGMEWGYSSASDLSSLYTMTVLGVEQVLESYPKGIPAPFTEFARDQSMEFMNRINPHAYSGVPAKQLARWYGRLIEHGVLPFEYQDWRDMSATMSLFK